MQHRLSKPGFWRRGMAGAGAGAFGLALCLTSLGAEQRTPFGEAPPAPPMTMPETLSGRIQGVQQDRVTVEVNGVMQEIQVPAATPITLNQKTVKLMDLAAGQWATLTLAPGRSQQALRIDAIAT